MSDNKKAKPPAEVIKHPGSNRTVGRAATGTDSKALQMRLLDLTLRSLVMREGEDQSSLIEAILDALAAINPRDGFEGILASQMVAVHETAMNCLYRAQYPSQPFEVRDMNLKNAAKFLQIYTHQVEVLDKHRGKDQQKITVQYVTGEARSQAIVGAVIRGESAELLASSGERASEVLNGRALPRPRRGSSGCGPKQSDEE